MHEQNDDTLETTQDKRGYEAERTQLTKTQMIVTMVGLVLTIALSLYAIITFLAIPTSPSPAPTPWPSDDPDVYVTPEPSASPDTTPQASASASPSATPIVRTITSPAGQIGSVSDTGTVTTEKSILVGRTQSEISRGFVGFDIAAIPATAKISKATLRLYQKAVTGTPFTSLGALQVDHLDYGSTLSAESYNGGTLFTSSIGTIDTYQTLVWKTVDVTEAVKKDRASHTSSQYRLRYAYELKGGNEQGDRAEFATIGSENEAPQLVIEYN